MVEGGGEGWLLLHNRFQIRARLGCYSLAEPVLYVAVVSVMLKLDAPCAPDCYSSGFKD